MEHIEELLGEPSDSIVDLEDGTCTMSYAASDAPIIREKRRRRKRVVESTIQRIESKKRLSMAFGITGLATVIACKSRPVCGKIRIY